MIRLGLCFNYQKLLKLVNYDFHLHMPVYTKSPQGADLCVTIKLINVISET